MTAGEMEVVVHRRCGIYILNTIYHMDRRRGIPGACRIKATVIWCGRSRSLTFTVNSGPSPGMKGFFHLRSIIWYRWFCKASTTTGADTTYSDGSASAGFWQDKGTGEVGEEKNGKNYTEISLKRKALGARMEVKEDGAKSVSYLL